MVPALLLAASDSQGQDDMSKLSEEALSKLIGKRSPLPGEGKAPGPNWTPKGEEKKAPSGSVERENFLNPKAPLKRREEAAGLKCGGKVKKMAGGGAVRGVGCATKGTGFKGSY